ncbi:MAG: phosphoglycerate kinase [Candidatus Kerfeldbacteria bacterium CG08_land_8_20_14_0_20_40_16]|uniref:Phosphoglycerate kinase n=1 Tax=Candidatus Kerfeldbacteria bacterium CG08_land_8_20_14_0_20_40_16 TaxID=2014244 RepID=A0A2H0YWB1_9BACT|nr:MAG: phosphoglycerate kinase [Candidatus Kerfeldbacteria bacterium CG08_land_8_20_14_0_20_40_16]
MEDSFNKKTIKDIDVSRKRILLRVAYDITPKNQDGKMVIKNDARIRATLPTIEYLLERNCSLVLLSWLKRPGGKVVEEYRMNPVAEKLSGILGRPVKKMDDCVGPEVEKAVKAMQPGEIIMLENVRFHPEEEKEDPAFAQQLADLGELVVFDAFAQSHRVHSSTTGILKQKEAVAGFLVEKELKILSGLLKNPERPFVVVLGGAKLSDKLETTINLIEKADGLLIGGAMANAFLKAKNIPIENSFIEDEPVTIAQGEPRLPVEIAQDILAKAAAKQPSLINVPNLDFLQLPLDLVAADSLAEPTKHQLVDLEKGEQLPKGWTYLDIGPKTGKLFQKVISQARTIFWNGPMGLFEEEEFTQGTKAVAEAIVASKATSIIGGGDTEKIVKMFKLEGKFSHVSTGGGASLEFLAGKKLPAVELLPNK